MTQETKPPTGSYPPGKMPRESLALSAEIWESPPNTAASPGHRTRGPGALPPSSCLDPGEGRSGGGEKKNWKGGKILCLEGEPVRKWTASVSRKTRPSEAGRGLCPNRVAPGRQVQRATVWAAPWGTNQRTEGRARPPGSRAPPAPARCAGPQAAFPGPR